MQNGLENVKKMLYIHIVAYLGREFKRKKRILS